MSAPETNERETPSLPTNRDTLPCVQNETPSKLVVSGSDDSTLVLAPLELRRFAGGERESFHSELETLEDLRCVTFPEARQDQISPAYGFVGLGFWILVAYLIAGIFFSSTTYWIVGAIVVAIPLVIGTIIAVKEPTPGSAAQLLGLLLVLTIGVIGPAAAVYFGGDVHEAVDGLQTANDELSYLTLIGRGLQIAFIAVASVLPALLFFLFDRVKLATLRQTFEREMFRFDPTVATLSDVRARYGALMDEVYGSPEAASTPRSGDVPAGSRRAGGSGRVLPGRRGPVILATLVIAVGWILALLNPDVEAPLDDAQDIVLLFEPQRSPVVYAFLGAYVFSLYSVLRSYVRSDLRPKSYSHIVIRILSAVIFAWVLEALFVGTVQPTTGEEALLVLAFVVGFFPDTLLIRLQEVTRHFVGRSGRALPTLYERYPLTLLEGIDIYDRSRLLDEGVGNIEGLAHHDLPALMMQTRIPAGRLVHWTDQAILFLHVGITGDKRPAAQEDGEDAGEGRLRTLRKHGIHTATDLLNAHDAVVRRARSAHAKRGESGELDAFRHLLGAETGPDGTALPRLQGILDTIKDEQWIANLRYWHSRRHDRPATLRLVDGHLVHFDDPAAATIARMPEAAAGDGQSDAAVASPSAASAPHEDGGLAQDGQSGGDT